MTRELISLFRVIFYTQKFLAITWAIVLAAALGALQLLIHSPDFHGSRSSSGSINFWILVDFLIVAMAVWIFSGYLGFLLNSVQRRNWLRQLPISANVLIVCPYLLLLCIAALVYLAMPIFWSIGSTAHALPGTFLFVFFPLLTFYLVRGTKRPVIWFATSWILAPVFYVLFFEQVLMTAYRSWWMAHIWSPWTQAIFLAFTFGLALIFDRKSKKALVVIAMLLGAFLGMTFMRTPFTGMKPTICNEVLEHQKQVATTEAYFIYTREEYLDCKNL